MRRIDLSPYQIKVTDGRSPDAKLREFLATPQVAIIRRLAAERLGVPPADFDAVAMEEVNRPEARAEQALDYDVRGSLVEILFHPGLELRAKDLLDRDTLARKINDWPGADLLLEEDEYRKVVAGLEAVRGLGRNDVEFVRRVHQAPQAEVEAKKPEDAK